MKKLLIVAITSLALSGCVKPSKDNPNGQIIEEFEYEKCQYIFVGGYHGGPSHKGNCNNPIHYGSIELKNGSMNINGVTTAIDTNIINK